MGEEFFKIGLAIEKDLHIVGIVQVFDPNSAILCQNNGRAVLALPFLLTIEYGTSRVT